MKYSNQQQGEFSGNGSMISFFIGLLNFFTIIYAEMINCWLLSFQSNIVNCIKHFIALAVINDIPKLYYDSLSDNFVKDNIKLKVENKTRGRDIKWSKRGFMQKL